MKLIQNPSHQTSSLVKSCRIASTAIAARIHKAGILQNFRNSSTTQDSASFQTFSEYKLPRELQKYALPSVIKQSQISEKNLGNFRIASVDDHGPVASLCVAVPSGARYEDVESFGVAHHIKASAFMGTQNQSRTRLQFEALLRAAKFECRLKRDHMLYCAKFLREDLDYVVETIADVIKNPVFPHWEHGEVSRKVEAESKLVFSDPAKLAMEKAYELTYRKHPLANCIVAPLDSMAARVSPSDQVKFSSKYANPLMGNQFGIAVVGAGHDDLLSAIKVGFSAKTQSSSDNQSPKTQESITRNQIKHQQPVASVFGGSARLRIRGVDYNKGEGAHGIRNCILIAFPTPPANEIEIRASLLTISTLINPKETFSFGNIGSALGNKLWKYRGLEPKVRVFHDTHKDGGLFCIESVSENAKEASRAANRVIDELRNLASGSKLVENIEQVIKRARLQNNLNYERREELAIALSEGQNYGISPHEQLDKEIEEMTNEKIIKSAKKILKNPLTFVVTGEIDKLPYPEDLGFH